MKSLSLRIQDLDPSAEALCFKREESGTQKGKVPFLKLHELSRLELGPKLSGEWVLHALGPGTSAFLGGVEPLEACLPCSCSVACCVRLLQGVLCMMASHSHATAFPEKAFPVPYSMPPKPTLSQVFTRPGKISRPGKGE